MPIVHKEEPQKLCGRISSFNLALELEPLGDFLWVKVLETKQIS